MANCPKCGSFVREGEECRFCNGGYGSHPKDEISVKIDNLLNSNNYQSSLNGNQYAKAKDCFDKREYEAAINYCDDYTYYYGNKSQVLFLKAKALFELKKYDETRECCELCINHDGSFHEEGYYKDHAHEILELKGDSFIGLNNDIGAINCYDAALKIVKSPDKWMTVARGHMLQAEAQAHERVVKEEKTKVYQIVASLAASKIFALQHSGKTEEATDCLIEYSFIKESGYPVESHDRYSSDTVKIYSDIDTFFKRKRMKFSLHNLEFPVKYIYCKNCGNKINYVIFRGTKHYSCPKCKHLMISYFNSYDDYENLKKQQRIKKEKQERGPEHLKSEIKFCKKKILSDYIVFLRFEHYQRKSDEKFKELLRLEDLLEKCNTETKPTKEDQKNYKKEIRRIKYCLSRMDEKYTANGKIVLEKYQKRLDEIEKKLGNRRRINIF